MEYGCYSTCKFGKKLVVGYHNQYIRSLTLGFNIPLISERRISLGSPINIGTGALDRLEIGTGHKSTYTCIDRAVDVLGTDNLIIMHCTSTYPSQPAELNLKTISTLKERYGVPIGYSGHEKDLSASIAAIALGACAIERHITLDKTMWGSDQSASLESQDFIQLVKNIRSVETALGDGIKRVYDSEIPIIQKLRRVGA